MSYCRWSSDDFSCDLYCYEHVDGTWTTHVASTRYVGEVPTLPLFPQVADAILSLFSSYLGGGGV